MIFYIAEGGIGNQLFQYAFLKTLRDTRFKGEKIVAYGFGELKETFDSVDMLLLPNPFFAAKRIPKIRSVYYRYEDLMYLLRDKITQINKEKRIISYVSVKKVEVNGLKSDYFDWEVIPGRFDRVIFVEPGFFQSERFFDKRALKIKMKEKFLEAAQRFLDRHSRNSYRVFVHVRLSDYRNFRVFGKEVILPESYYRRLINWFKENKRDCFFVIISDEPNKAESMFSDIKEKVVSKNHYSVDLAIMTLCQGGILSPSSFSWWGAYLMEKRDVVFAPRYWLGWKSNIEYPVGVFPSFCTEVEVTS